MIIRLDLQMVNHLMLVVVEVHKEAEEGEVERQEVHGREVDHLIKLLQAEEEDVERQEVLGREVVQMIKVFQAAVEVIQAEVEVPQAEEEVMERQEVLGRGAGLMIKLHKVEVQVEEVKEEDHVMRLQIQQEEIEVAIKTQLKEVYLNSYKDRKVVYHLKRKILPLNFKQHNKYL